MAQEVAEVGAARAIVLDANILLRAILGTRVRTLIERYAEQVMLLTPQSCVEETREYLPLLCAKRRIASRDPDDWPVVALAMALNAPVWTEDRDFFGAGVATWTTKNVELYLARAASS